MSTEPMPSAGAAPGPPLTDTERALAAIWSEVLEVPHVSVEQNFFDLGGHSVLLHMVLDRITTRLGTNPPLIELFHHPTVRSLAAYLDGHVPGPGTGAGRAEGSRAGGRARLAGRRNGRIGRPTAFGEGERHE
ncbi:phosphopantetheine binding protein [Kitasatospora sp. SolWspMP-SS2h]|uniref:phosphopantetheine-binding protein n=1 Tax=Kitasatospora sp. SolWspMP-SS2h TaxID=1305729 RepID=UPI000DBFAAEC|nr:phosphopantetheine-binding protein [Kitasatospora sp. SolWspMP-SS2h]RAJ43057.1 phosphopantetheine binding protein [Kitasatospora sp. SolWspMP-SS2h]